MVKRILRHPVPTAGQIPVTGGGKPAGRTQKGRKKRHTHQPEPYVCAGCRACFCAWQPSRRHLQRGYVRFRPERGGAPRAGRILSRNTLPAWYDLFPTA